MSSQFVWQFDDHYGRVAAYMIPGISYDIIWYDDSSSGRQQLCSCNRHQLFNRCHYEQLYVVHIRTQVF